LYDTAELLQTIQRFYGMLIQSIQAGCGRAVVQVYRPGIIRRARVKYFFILIWVVYEKNKSSHVINVVMRGLRHHGWR
jgi:hypothetical protein